VWLFTEIKKALFLKSLETGYCDCGKESTTTERPKGQPGKLLQAGGTNRNAMIKKKINKIALLIFLPVFFIECNNTVDTGQNTDATDSSKNELIKEKQEPLQTRYHQSACGSGIATR